MISQTSQGVLKDIQKPQSSTSLEGTLGQEEKNSLVLPISG